MMAFFGQMAVLDWLIFGGVAFLVIRGFISGCSGEISRPIGLAAAVVTGYASFVPVERAVLAAKLFAANPYAGRLVAIMIILVIGISVWLLLSRLLKDGLRMVINQPFDAILGGVIGGFKAFVVVAILCALGFLNPREESQINFLNNSLTMRKFTPLFHHIAAQVPLAADTDKTEEEATQEEPE